MIDLQSYWEKGISYPLYVDIISKQTDHPLFSYTQLNLKRMERLHRTLEFPQEYIAKILSRPRAVNLLVISEGWCGDAAQILPVIDKIQQLKPELEVRIVFRDEHNELMQQYLTDGSESIPIVIGLSDSFQEIFRWGPRPKYGMELLKKHKLNPEVYSKDNFYQDLQLWYNRDKGKTIFRELVHVLFDA